MLSPFSRLGLGLCCICWASACRIITDQDNRLPPSEVTPVPPDKSIPPTDTVKVPATETGSHQFVIDSNSDAAMDAKALKASQPMNAKLLQLIADQASAVWFGEWNKDIMGDAQHLAQAAIAQGRYALLVVYAIPQRDCGNYSAGGLEATRYQEWIKKLVAGLGQTPAYIILEPDAIVLTECLKEADRLQRFALIQSAVKELKKNPQARVYIDVGHPAWLSVDEAVNRLQQAGIEFADGFSLNVSNYQWAEDCIRYGQDIRGRIGGKGFVIDSSRNGKGPLSKDAWCNPPDRAVGHFPLAPSGLAGLDAYLWIKKPGESDGTCNGGPNAGQWWQSKAIELIRNAELKE